MAAYEVAMESGDRAKYRDPGLVILWTILTLGVYNAVWYFKINRELRDFGRARERRGDPGQAIPPFPCSRSPSAPS